MFKEKYPLIQSFVLLEIHNIEMDLLFAAVFDFEVEPLQVPFSVRVDSHKKVVFIIVYFYDWVKVATFVVAFKSELCALLNGRIHSFEDACVFRFEVCVELTEVGVHVGVVGSCGSFMFEVVVPFHFLVHFEGGGVTMS